MGTPHPWHCITSHKHSMPGKISHITFSYLTLPILQEINYGENAEQSTFFVKHTTCYSEVFTAVSVLRDMTQCEASGSFSRVKRTKKDDSWSTWLLGTKRCQEALTQQHSNTSMKTPTLRFKDNFQRHALKFGQELFSESEWTADRLDVSILRLLEIRQAELLGRNGLTEAIMLPRQTTTVLTDTVRTTALKTADNDLTRPTFHSVRFAGSSLPICKDCSIETIKHWCNQSPNGFFIYIILTGTERVQITSVSFLFNQYIHCNFLLKNVGGVCFWAHDCVCVCVCVCPNSLSEPDH